ncbi:MAG: hypothetical protein Kow0060_15500 [Methylohalobius crimeensis]
MKRWRFELFAATALIGLVASGFFGWQYWRQSEAAQQAENIRQGQGKTPSSSARPALQLTWANHLAAKNRYEEALEIFSRLLEISPARLMPAVHYNLGNLYLRRALGFLEDVNFDEAAPLVELAKRSYREALRLQPALWAAKYNLEMAIRLMPQIESPEAAQKESKKPPEALWTRVPGFPRGLP